MEFPVRKRPFQSAFNFAEVTRAGSYCHGEIAMEVSDVACAPRTTPSMIWTRFVRGAHTASLGSGEILPSLIENNPKDARFGN